MQGREYAEKHFAQMKREAEEEVKSQMSENLETDERDASADEKPDNDIQRSVKPRSTDAKKELDDNSDLGYNKIKKTSTGDLSNEQNAKDPGLLVHGQETSAVSESEDGLRKRGNDTSAYSAQMENDGKLSERNAGKSGHDGNATSWLSRERFVSQTSFNRFRETILRDRSGLNSTDANGKTRCLRQGGRKSPKYTIPLLDFRACWKC